MKKKYNKDIPVVVAGGISDKNKVKHAFDLGAQGVQVATRLCQLKNVMQMKITKKNISRPKKKI